MTSVNPNYYGLVKQIGPWKTTSRDMLNGQTYKYTPNQNTELPYIVKSGNGQLYESYASQGLIYDASTAPVMTVKGKLRRGKIVKAKKVQIIDPSGNIVAPTDNYFLNRYMGEMRASVRNSIIQSDLGQGQSDMAMMSPRPSTISMNGRPSTNSEISVDSSAPQSEGPAFEDLGIEGPRVDQQDDLSGEEMVDRGAQNGDQVLNDQIGYVQALEEERIYATPNVMRDRWMNLEHNALLDHEDDQDYLLRGEELPGYNADVNMDLDPVSIPGYQARRRRSSLASRNPRPNQRQRN